MPAPNPAIEVAVVMRKERVQGAASRWQTWRWVLSEVVAGGAAAGAGPGAQPCRLYSDGNGEAWLHPGLSVELFRDEAEGYDLNVHSPAPCWFVMWRLEDAADDGGEPMAVPQRVTLSYHEAGRLLDAQETVEQVPLPPEVREWLRAFAAQHHVAEPKRRQRPQSFKPLTDRFGNPASVSTGKAPGGGRG